MLTERQKLTIEHLKEINHITSSDEIIAFCVRKLKCVSFKRVLKSQDKNREKRHHSKQYYREIILHYRHLSKEGTGGQKPTSRKTSAILHTYQTD